MDSMDPWSDIVNAARAIEEHPLAAWTELRRLSERFYACGGEHERDLARLLAALAAAVEKPTSSSYYGGCPYCGDDDGYLNIGIDHWFICDLDMTKWYMGSNVFSIDEDETEQVWEENAARLARYRKVAPVFVTAVGMPRRSTGDADSQPD
jgi:hypothetical protein